MAALTPPLVAELVWSGERRFGASSGPIAFVARAIELSREKYCSVWHSLREDITLTTSIDILP
jgi:hypothetical protein